MKPVEVLAKVSLLIFLYYVVYAFYVGIIHPIPAKGDSFDYHIPISQSILDGNFLAPTHQVLPQRYYPGSSDAINAVFLLLHIPLTLSNLFAIVVLFFVLWKAGRVFVLDVYSSLLFAVAFTSLTAVFRWANAVSSDVWVAVFFVLTIILLERPQNTVRFFALLGVCFGMLIGSKYTAVLYIGIFVLVYYKALISSLSLRRIVAFCIPFSIFGLYWYIRNYFLLGNPAYPLCVFSLPCVHLFSDTILTVGLSHPLDIANAVFGEYKLWVFSPFILLFIVYVHLKRRRLVTLQVRRLLIIGIMGMLLFLFFPTTNQPWIMVSSMRYSYPVWIPFILVLFILAKQYKKELSLGFFAVGNMILTLSIPYYPKLVFIYIPVAFFIFRTLDIYTKKLSSKNTD